MTEDEASSSDDDPRSSDSLETQVELPLDVGDTSESCPKCVTFVVFSLPTIATLAFDQWNSKAAYATLAAIWLAWAGRSFIHYLKGDLSTRSTDGNAPLRKWLIAEWVLAAASLMALCGGDVLFHNRAFHSIVLVFTAAFMWLIGRAEALKIDMEAKKLRPQKFVTGTAWLGDRIYDKNLKLKRLLPLFSRSYLVTLMTIVLVIAAMMGYVPAPWQRFITKTVLQDGGQAEDESTKPVETPSTPNSPSSSMPTTPSASPPHVTVGPTPEPTAHQETYDELCVIPGKGPQPGTGASPWAQASILKFVLGRGVGVGGGVTGCLQKSLASTSRTYYAIGLDPETAALKTVVTTTKDCGAHLFTGAAVRPILALLESELSICPEVRHAVGLGDVQLIQTQEGTFTFIRASDGAATPYTVLTPAETAAWAQAEEETHRWLWPHRIRQNLQLSDRDGPLDYYISPGAGNAALTRNGKETYFNTRTVTRWTQVSQFAPTSR